MFSDVTSPEQCRNLTSGYFFADEANQTIGKAAITEDVIINRRRVTSKLSPQG